MNTYYSGDVIFSGDIGNVMGSNSVNVFLGLGISWTIGAIYWDHMVDGPTEEWLRREHGIPPTH